MSDIFFDGGGECALLTVVYCFIFPDSRGGYAVEFDGLFIYYLHYASLPTLAVSLQRPRFSKYSCICSYHLTLATKFCIATYVGERHILMRSTVPHPKSEALLV